MDVECERKGEQGTREKVNTRGNKKRCRGRGIRGQQGWSVVRGGTRGGEWKKRKT